MTHVAELDSEDQSKIVRAVSLALGKNPNRVAKIEITYLPKT